MHRSPLAWLRLLLAAVLGAFLLGGPLHAAETAAPRSPAWAQAVDPSINLYRMSPTLYRSALPNAQSVALLQRLQVKTVVSFIKDDDRAWLGQAPVRVVSLPTHADRVDDAEVLSRAAHERCPDLPALQRRPQHPPARPCATGSALRRL